ncbi:peptidase family M48-domain-containing protein [Gongronella butleri]|nr:peptidase family M48-domain-containing protein [Gongronella butleri]
MRPVPLLPLPAVLAGLVKSGKLVSLVSLSSKTSLTLLPHSLRKGKGATAGKILVGVPLVGLTLLLAVGLDLAPNTQRMRFLYMSDEEEKVEVDKAVDEMLVAQSPFVAADEHPRVVWLKSIVANLAKAAQDDISAPVRKMDDEASLSAAERYVVHLIEDDMTLNAMCAGRHILVYDLMMQVMGYDPNKMAVILSHEMAHSVQRHFAETHGFVSLMLMLGDITRGVLWMVTDAFGPYVNEKIHETIRAYIDREADTSYSRPLEREADLVGLRFLAKAGYDPRIALDVWELMAEIDEEIAKLEKEEQKEIEITFNDVLEGFMTAWFGSSHPPSSERVAYIREHMDEAVVLYEEAIKLNGKPQHPDVDDSAVAKARGWASKLINRLWPLK